MTGKTRSTRDSELPDPWDRGIDCRVVIPASERENAVAPLDAAPLDEVQPAAGFDEDSARE